MTAITNSMLTDMDLLDPFCESDDAQLTEYANPFFVPTAGSDLKYTKTRCLSEEYSCVLVLCLVDDFEATEANISRIKLFHQADADMSELKRQAPLVTLLKGPLELLRLNSLRSGLVSVDKSVLEYFNHEAFDLDEHELVVLMTETKSAYIRKWLALYDENNSFDDFVSQKILASFYNLDDKRLNESMMSCINRLADSNYWSDANNCRLTIDRAFSKRKFNLSFVDSWSLPVEDIEKELQKILINFQQNPNKSALGDKARGSSHAPLEPVEPALQTAWYVDGSRGDKSYFGVTKTDQLTIDQSMVEEMLIGHALSREEKYRLLVTLLASKNYCHYVVRSKTVLEACAGIIQAYKPAFRYVLGYAWMTLYMEESIIRTRMSEKERCVIDIETASRLPVFPFCPSAPRSNPYFSSTIPDKELDQENNMWGVEQPIEYQNGIVDLAELERRLRIFVGGPSQADLLKDADWSHMALTGGCMAACLPKTNPLFALFKANQDPKVPITDAELNRFFQEYYASSDIDIACNHENLLEYIRHVKHLHHVIHKNLHAVDASITEADITLEPMKTVAIYVNPKQLKAKCEAGEVPFTYELMIKDKNNHEFKFYFYELYLEQKRLSNKTNRSVLGSMSGDPAFFEIVRYCDFDTATIIINDVPVDSPGDTAKNPELNSGIEMVYRLAADSSSPITDSNPIFVKFSETLKYKITSRHLERPIEVFRINEPEFFSCVSRFHLPCVRAYYTESKGAMNCFMLPSAITSYMTLTNIDFKYFVGRYDPINIIDKYRQRGYGIVLNGTEIKQYLSYVLNIEKHARSYKVSTVEDIRTILGTLSPNMPFFTPRRTTPEIFKGDTSIKLEYATSKLSAPASEKDVLNLYLRQHATIGSIAMTRTIGPDGNIQPLKKWLIDAVWDMLS